MRREPGLGRGLVEPRSAAGLPIVAQGVGYVHGVTPILADIDLTIARGGRTFVLGPNGAGKSTLLRILHGLIAPTQGTVTWNGARTRPAEQAMVFQRPVLLRRSVESNLRYALALSGVHGAHAERRIFEALTEVGLLDVAKRSARVLSWGEQQRLALARAWALDPAVLFLDEPTASLDPNATRAVEKIVSDIHARGTTIVMTTHNLAQAKRLADEIVFLHAGHIVERTPAASFFRSPQSAEAAAYLEGERL
jgi:tungstate transport system ATP-binding protein